MLAGNQTFLLVFRYVRHSVWILYTLRSSAKRSLCKVAPVHFNLAPSNHLNRALGTHLFVFSSADHSPCEALCYKQAPFLVNCAFSRCLSYLFVRIRLQQRRHITYVCHIPLVLWTPTDIKRVWHYECGIPSNTSSKQSYREKSERNLYRTHLVVLYILNTKYSISVDETFIKYNKTVQAKSFSF